MSVENRINEVRSKVLGACMRANRNPNEVHFIGVTKYLNLEQTKHVLDGGIDHVGESRIQDALAKMEKLDQHATWHFIGSLQRRKVKDIIGRFTYLHSLDRYELAVELNKQFEKNKGTLKCFIQINVSGEKSKSGIFPHELEKFLDEMTKFRSLEIVGLMTMAPKVANPEDARFVFRRLKELQQEAQTLNYAVPHLSMGMSQDYEVAIEEGATWVRLGTALVGP